MDSKAFWFVIAIVVVAVLIYLDTLPAIEIHANAPRWIEQDQTATIRITVVNNKIHRMIVGVNIQTLYDYLEILYPADKYVVVEISPRGSYTLDVSVRGVREGEEHISISAVEDDYYGFPLWNAFIAEKLLKVMVFSRQSLRSITLNLYANFKVF